MTDEEALEYWEKIRKTFMEHYESEDSYWGRHHWMTSVQAVDSAISALHDRIARQNPQPLTLDELREMDGEPQPVYLVSERYEEGNGWKICHGMNDNGMINFGDEAWSVQVFEEGYVKAYRTKPEQEVRNREA